jgi:hypothetical protein
MRNRIAMGVMAVAALAVAGVADEPALKSGPQVGSSNITPFNPLHCSGAQEGTKSCLV